MKNQLTFTNEDFAKDKGTENGGLLIRMSHQNKARLLEAAFKVGSFAHLFSGAYEPNKNGDLRNWTSTCFAGLLIRKFEECLVAWAALGWQFEISDEVKVPLGLCFLRIEDDLFTQHVIEHLVDVQDITGFNPNDWMQAARESGTTDFSFPSNNPNNL